MKSVLVLLGVLLTLTAVCEGGVNGKGLLFPNLSANSFKLTPPKTPRKNHTVQSGGAVILGQHPNCFIGKFEGQSFVGETSDMNMWDHVLMGDQIRNISDGVFFGTRTKCA
ncbi:hypothetical protein SRHO_G00049220 [Serrasalmus rhombeus]